MIKAYAGYFGEGKTLSMVSEATEYLKKGFTIYTNTPFITKKFHYYDIKGILKRKKLGYYQELKPVYLEPEQFNYALANANNALFILDEASIWFSNYNWNSIDSKILYRLHQVRKLNIHIIYTCQAFKHVIKRLRDFTQIVVDCKTLFRGSKNEPLLIRHLYYDPAFFSQNIYSLELEQKFIKKRTYLFGKKLKEAMKEYDTNDLISFSMGSQKTKYESKAGVNEELSKFL